MQLGWNQQRQHQLHVAAPRASSSSSRSRFSKCFASQQHAVVGGVLQQQQQQQQQQASLGHLQAHSNPSTSMRHIRPATLHLQQQQQQLLSRAHAQRRHAVGMVRLRTAAHGLKALQAGVVKAC
jgi:hypothetical protein